MALSYRPDLARGEAFRPPRQSLLLGLIVLTCVGVLFIAGLSYLMSGAPIQLTIVAGISMAFGILCFVNAKLVLYLLLFFCLFSPEVPLGDVLGRAAKRPVTIRIEDLLLVIIGLTWLARAAVDKELGLMRRTPLNRAVIRYAIVCIVATAIGVAFGWVESHLGAALFVLKYIQYFVLFFMIVNHIDRPRDVRNLFAVGIVTYVGVCLYGLAQVPQGVRPTAFAEGQAAPNTLAGYLLLMVGITSGLLLYARQALHKVAWGLLSVLGLVLLAYTLSRSGWAGLAGVLLVLVFFGRHKLVLVGSLAVVAGVLALLSFEATWLPEPIARRVEETISGKERAPDVQPIKLFGRELDPSASERLGSYRDALRNWWNRTQRYWVPLLTGSGVLGSRPFVDGQYVRVLVETGLLGLGTFLALLAAIWRNTWRACRELRTPWYRGLALGYLAGFAGLLIHAFGANTFIIVRIMEPFFIFTGIVVLLPSIEEHPDHALNVGPMK